MEESVLYIDDFFYFQLSIATSEDVEAVSRAVINTVLGGCSGGLLVLFYVKYRIGKWSYLQTLNGTLTGKIYNFSTKVQYLCIKKIQEWWPNAVVATFLKVMQR